MKLIYDVDAKPKFGQLLVFAFQQLLAIMAATIVVPVIINGNAGLAGEDAMSQAAALLGFAGVTKRDASQPYIRARRNPIGS